MRPPEPENPDFLARSCSCCESLDILFRARMFDHAPACCSRFGDEPHRAKTATVHYPPRPLSQPPEERRSALQNFLLTRASLVSEGLLPHDHYDPCWAFSSMPEIPATLLDDEFIVDAGIRMPSQLASSQSTSKIPNLQDIIFRNRRLNNGYDKNRRSGIFSRPTKRYSMEYEDCLKQKSNGHFSGNSVDYEEGVRRQGEESRLRRYPGFPGKGQESERNKSKRHSMNLGMKLPPEPKDQRPRFKRYSMEVPSYSADRGPRVLKRFSTLDVNHNQGSSKIPLRNQASGSRTAPSTRASSPVPSEPRMLFEKSPEEGPSSGARSSLRFSSSDEEIDKLCRSFLNKPASLREKESSKLPIRTQRKKM